MEVRPMTMQMALVLLVTAIIFFGFVRERQPPDVTALLGVSLLLIFGALEAGQFLSVFANGAPITIGAMFVLSKALENTGVIAELGRVAKRVAGASWLRAMLLLLLPVTFLSAFVNNTPVVVVLTPVVITLAHQQGHASSRYLIPLSFASILGGTCTLVGTSTNLLVDSIAQREGMAAFGIFEITGVGIILAIAGLLYVLLFGWWLLPDRPERSLNLPAGERRFLTEAIVPPGSPLVGKRVSDGSLSRHRVLQIHRGEHVIKRNTMAAVLRAGDRLVIESARDEVANLRGGRIVQMSEPGKQELEKGDLQTLAQRQTQLAEAIVGPEARILGMTVTELNLERRFGVFVLGVHRHKKRLKRGFDQLRLKVGDILLLEGRPRDLSQLYNNRSFVNVAVPEIRALQREKAPLAILAIVLVVILAALKVMPIVVLAVIGATFVVLVGCLSADEAYEAVQWPILMLIFAMLAVGLALEQTGAMNLLVTALTQSTATLGPIGMLITLYIVTSLATEVMSNNAAAILLTPIAIGVAANAGLDPRPFIVAVMLAGSASFATPIGYQTNTFVYQAGGYRFTDFIRIGLPMNVLALLVSVLVIPWFWPLDSGTD
ncbi:SLC13 family permease [Elongatibacter sediminis]|uniref:SLC13 family permease n=1 Tax=Elongatibacter sediminis TaxID=3119006 RepID=A0AAW9R8Z1_9GAMM